ncbi:MAG: hypothetical protein PWP08_1407 [Methanofollis sp.]|nr:hypothetical protein [Methanofollis sp.]
MTTFGVIGTGSMLIRKMVESGQADAHSLIAYNRSEEKARATPARPAFLSAKVPGTSRNDQISFFSVSDPLKCGGVLKDLRGVLTPEKLLVSVASDITLENLSAWSDARAAKVIHARAAKVIPSITKETFIGTARLLAEYKIGFDGLISRVATEGGITREGVDIIRHRMPDVFDKVLAKTHAKHCRIQQKIRDQETP